MSQNDGVSCMPLQRKLVMAIAVAFVSSFLSTAQASDQLFGTETFQQSSEGIATLEVSAFGRHSAEALLNVGRAALRVYLEEKVGSDFLLHHAETVREVLFDKSENYVLGVHIRKENRYPNLLEVAARVNLDEIAIERKLTVIRHTDAIDRSVMRN